jgi:hypothetical protein
MHSARISHTATLLRDGRVLIVGRRGQSLAATAEIYDPKTRTFSDTGKLTTPRYKHTAAMLPDGRVLVAGGSDEQDWSGKLSAAEIYDPATGKFSAVTPMHEPRFKLPDTAVTLANGKVLIAGGGKQAEVFDPSTGRFFAVPGEMHDARHFMTATRLPDGRALLVGGYPNNDQGTAETWLYRP